MKKTLLIIVLFATSCIDTSTNREYALSENKPAQTILTKEQQEELLVNNKIKELVSDSLCFAEVKYFEDKTQYGNRSMSDALDLLLRDYELNDSVFINNRRIQNLVKFIKTKQRTKRATILPLYRKTFANNLRTSMWEHNVEIYTSGKSYTILNATSYIFADNANIKLYHEILYRDAAHFGFSQIRYRWYKGQDEYQYFKLN